MILHEAGADRERMLESMAPRFHKKNPTQMILHLVPNKKEIDDSKCYPLRHNKIKIMII